MDDLKQRLRDGKRWIGGQVPAEMTEAAAALDAKDAEIARLRSELQSATAPHTNRITMGRAAMSGRVRLLEAEIARLRVALERVMVGGNHLAVWLPEPCPPVETEPLVALEQIGAGIHYDVWCCWRAIMQSRAALSATTKE